MSSIIQKTTTSILNKQILSDSDIKELLNHIERIKKDSELSLSNTQSVVHYNDFENFVNSYDLNNSRSNILVVNALKHVFELQSFYTSEIKNFKNELDNLKKTVVLALNKLETIPTPSGEEIEDFDYSTLPDVDDIDPQSESYFELKYLIDHLGYSISFIENDINDYENEINNLEKSETIIDLYKANKKETSVDTSSMGSLDLMLFNSLNKKKENTSNLFKVNKESASFKVGELFEISHISNQNGIYASFIETKEKEYLKYNIIFKVEDGYTQIQSSTFKNKTQLSIYCYDNDLKFIESTYNLLQYIKVGEFAFSKFIQFSNEPFCDLNSFIYSHSLNSVCAKGFSVVKKDVISSDYFLESPISGFDFWYENCFNELKNEFNTINKERESEDFYFSFSQAKRNLNDGHWWISQQRSLIQPVLFALNDFEYLERDRILLNKKEPLHFPNFSHLFLDTEKEPLSLNKSVGNYTKLDDMDILNIKHCHINPIFGQKVFDSGLLIKISKDHNYDDFIEYKTKFLTDDIEKSISNIKFNLYSDNLAPLSNYSYFIEPIYFTDDSDDSDEKIKQSLLYKVYLKKEGYLGKLPLLNIDSFIENTVFNKIDYTNRNYLHYVLDNRNYPMSIVKDILEQSGATEKEISKTSFSNDEILFKCVDIEKEERVRDVDYSVVVVNISSKEYYDQQEALEDFFFAELFHSFTLSLDKTLKAGFDFRQAQLPESFLRLVPNGSAFIVVKEQKDDFINFINNLFVNKLDDKIDYKKILTGDKND